MIKIGILSVRKEKGRVIDKLFKPVKITDIFETQFKITVAEYSYTKNEIKNLLPIFRLLLKKIGEHKFKKAGILRVFHTNECRASFGNEKKTKDKNSGIKPEFLSEAIEYALNILSEKSINGGVYIIDKNLEYLDLSLLKFLCTKVRYINIFTDKKACAEIFSDKLYDQYGIITEVFDYKSKIPVNAMLTADFNAGTVRIERQFIIDGCEPELDLHGYNIDKTELLEYAVESGITIHYKAWLSGKKQLTIL